MKYLSVIAALSLSCLAANGAAAEPLKSIRFGYSHLDLSAPSASAEMDRRLQDAATRVCVMQYGEAPIVDVRARMILKRCRAIAIANARPQVTAAIDSAVALAAKKTPAVVAQR